MEEKTAEKAEAKIETAPEVKTPQAEVQETDASQDQEAGKADPVLDGHWQTNPFFYDVANYFGVQPRDFEVAKDQLGAIVDFVVDKYDVKAPEEILLKLRELEDVIQRPQWDEKRYTTLYRYVRLASQARSIEKAMKAFERQK